MAVFRVEKTKNFTVMSNYHLQDEKLTLKSKGLLSLMLSLPDSWDYTLKGLARISVEGVDSIRKSVNELEKYGYIKRSRLRNSKGRLGDIEYTIYEKPMLVEPVLENPTLDNPIPDKPVQEKSTQLNTNTTNIKKENTDSIKYQSINQDAKDTNVYHWIIHQNIDYDILLEQGYDQEQLDEIVEIMFECICSAAPTQRIGKEDISTEVVKSRFLKINSSHIEYIFNSMKENTTDVRNIKAYLKTVIYNAPVTIGNYYAAKVNHDLYGAD